MSKKDFTKATGAATNKFFSIPGEEREPDNAEDKHTNVTNVDNVTQHTNITNNTKHAQVSNKSKHYDKRGKRDIRQGLLIDKQLKEDLSLLCRATGARSINDYIVSLLVEHTELPENQKLLEEFSKY